MMNINFDIEKQIKTHYVIHKYSAKASTSVAEKVWKKKLVLTKPWLVLENIGSIKPLLAEMLLELGNIYEANITESNAKLKVNIFLLKQAPKFVVGGLVTIKGVSELTNATIAGLLTEKLGWQFVESVLGSKTPSKDADKRFQGIVENSQVNGVEKRAMDFFGVDIPYEKRIKCHYIIHSAATAVSGASLVKIPLIGNYSVEAIQSGMILSLAKVFDVPITIELAKEYLLKWGKNKGVEYTQQALSTIPVLVGRITTSTINAILTERMGWQVAVEFNNRSK